ncbi:hypothetical protein L227DRAFT_608433 [Lentinus tigrinus ALCF2SS1-6]|uniref:Uncharacterized protein n=1 Tax=Lentinus tigrinus ALCF2SS1-6 TaxID=1328759 RepID=A0A5C2SJC5_9APHY|nr:hypothetical protein L227DRAFT_608433 [Lentinus tigrinus ALCF2SS1-6]
MSFVPAKSLLSEQRQVKWVKGSRGAAKNLSPAIQKQYEKQIERFMDFATSAEGEVMPFAGFLPAVGLQPYLSHLL